MDEFLKAHTINEVSKLISIPTGTLRQWETDFGEFLIIPRDQKGSRYYTELEIETLKQIKEMREKNISKKMIRELFSQRGNDESPKTIQPTVPQIKQSEVVESLRDIQNLPEEMSQLFSAIKEELKNEVREEVRKELQNSSEHQKKLMESSEKEVESLSHALKRRDEILMENLKLMKELKEEKNKGFFRKMFKR